MIKQISYLFLPVLLLGMFSCGPQRYAVAPVAEDDDLYYNPGDVYISEAEAMANGEADTTSDAEADYDYWDEDRPNNQFNNPNPFSNRQWNPNMNRFSQPRLSFHYNVFRGSPGFGMGINSGWNYPFAPYDYGFSAFGWSQWGSPYGPNMYDPFWDPYGFDPFFGPSWNNPCWNSPTAWNNGWGNQWGNPWANPWNNGWGNQWGNPWANPWNNGWGNPWFVSDPWAANNNFTYGARPTITSNSGAGSNYEEGAIYDPERRVVQDNNGFETTRTDRPIMSIDNDLQERETFDYYDPTPSNTTRERNNATQQRNTNNGFNWNDFFNNSSNTERNNNSNTRPSNSNSRPSYTPTPPSNNSRSGGTRPSNSTRTKPSSGRSSGRSGGRR